MSKSKKPWAGKWQTIDKFGETGQSWTYKVVSLQENPPGEFVLKALKENKVERRVRFLNEISALRTLRHPGIADLVDDNSQQENSEGLYLVTKYIKGDTLEKSIIEAGSYPVEKAIEVMFQILNTLEFCHARGVVHRDIKPDNIVFDEAGYPVLIDFGIAFIDEQDSSSFKTELDQDLGNRFLFLPELRASDNANDKRDHRSDLTSTCGLLLFMLTGKRPVQLVDSQGNLPHQRGDIKDAIKLEGAQLSALKTLFERGFRYQPSERFQTIEELRTALDGVVAKVVPSTGSANMREALLKLNQSPDEERKRTRYKILCDISDGLDNAHFQVRQVLAKEFEDVQSSRSLDPELETFRNNKGFRHRLKPKLMIMPRFSAEFIGTDLVVTASLDSKNETLWRIEEKDFSTTSDLQDRIRAYFDRTITKSVDLYLSSD